MTNIFFRSQWLFQPTFRSMATAGKHRLFLYLSIVVIACRAVLNLIYPMLSTDGPWVLSPVFSYMMGKGDDSLFVWEFQGPVYTVNTTDFLYATWFWTFGINTWSFILLGTATLLATVVIWHVLLKRSIEGDGWPVLIPLTYALSGYVYMYRPECFSILALSFMLLCLQRLDNRVLKWATAGGLVVLAGLNHPLGGVYGCILLGYFLLQGRHRLGDYLMAAGLSIGMAFLLSGGQLLQFLDIYLTRPGDGETHFTGVDFSLLTKYFIQGSPFLILLLPLVFFWSGTFGRLMLGASLLVLLVSGRSYYYPYLHVAILAAAIFEKSIRTSAFKVYEALLRVSLAYSWMAFLVIPIALGVLSYKEQTHWWKVLASIDQEEKTWETDTSKKYYAPAQLSMEIYDNPQARLLYSWMYKDIGIQDAQSHVFYIYNKSQLAWIQKNFRSKGARWETQEMIPPAQGSMRIASFYRCRLLYHDSVGLWKVQALTDLPADHKSQ